MKVCSVGPAKSKSVVQLITTKRPRDWDQFEAEVGKRVGKKPVWEGIGPAVVRNLRARFSSEFLPPEPTAAPSGMQLMDMDDGDVDDAEVADGAV